MKTNLLGRRIATMVLVVMLLSTLTTLFVSANNNTDVHYSYTYSSSIDTCWTATRSKTDSSSHYFTITRITYPVTYYGAASLSSRSGGSGATLDSNLKSTALYSNERVTYSSTRGGTYLPNECWELHAANPSTYGLNAALVGESMPSSQTVTGVWSVDSI